MFRLPDREGSWRILSMGSATHSSWPVNGIAHAKNEERFTLDAVGVADGRMVEPATLHVLILTIGQNELQAGLSQWGNVTVY